MDFYSPKHLADYLNYLDQNQTAYNSYFKWKKYASVLKLRIGGFVSTLCSMCIYLQLENFIGIKSGQINDIEAYWGVNYNCKIPYMQNVSIFQLA